MSEEHSRLAHVSSCQQDTDETASSLYANLDHVVAQLTPPVTGQVGIWRFDSHIRLKHVFKPSKN